MDFILYGFSIARNAFNRNKIYLSNHILNTVGSFIFGYIYASIWRAVLKDSDESGKMVTYVMVNQAALWVSMFLPYGCFLPEKVRDGSIVFQILRPFNIMYYSFFETLGHVCYNFLYRSIPIYILSVLLLGTYLPEPSQILPYFISLSNAFLVAFFLNYFVGLWAVKFFDFSAAQGLYYFFMNILGGFFIPAEFFPGFISRIFPYTPFACTSYISGSIYLGNFDFLKGFYIQFFWILVLGTSAYILSEKVIKKINIQGG